MPPPPSSASTSPINDDDALVNLGHVVLDTAMVETAAYVLKKQISKGAE